MTSNVPSHQNYQFGKWNIILENADKQGIVVTYGDAVIDLEQEIRNRNLPLQLINACFLNPVDETLIENIGKLQLPIFVYETDMKSCGLAKDMTFIYSNKKMNVEVYSYGIEDHFIPQGTIQQLLTQEGISPSQVMDDIERILHEKGKN